MKRTFVILILLIFLAACVPEYGSGIPTPAGYALATAAPNATATPTPFQPLPLEELMGPTSAESATPLPPVPALPTAIAVTPSTPVPTLTVTAVPPTAAATVTLDPNSLLPTAWVPPTFYSPDYAPTPSPVLSDTETVTFLLLGSDSRGERYFRTDTIVIAAVRPRTAQVTLISVPRDLWVYVPNHGMDRVNTAYEYGEIEHYSGGGQALLKDTILYNLGVRIDHLAIIDFNGFRRIVDTLGGIDVPVFCPYTDWRLISPNLDPQNENNWALYTAGPGLVHMDGDLALWYARSRQRSNDFDRGRRSQEVLRALYTQALEVNAVSQIPQLYNDFQSAVTTDLSLGTILQLTPLAVNLSNADIRSYYIGRDYVTGWTTPGGASVLLPNGPAIQAMLSQALAPSARAPEVESLLIEVRNGTPYAGWDALAAERLNYAGYTTRLAPADRTNYTGSLLYDLTATQDPNRLASLLAILGLPQTAVVSAPMPDAGVPYVLIVGTDYQPCFNPVNMAP